ncbi:DNA-binding MurR/RpiR family transcriptional regulator [Paenibacillus forsythiae]|uniref:DNA-binding MurR/RpiR family transcriptional regulator n=1 Tax=Paenibacillus forsythiae TaxID=365616 RepID=A0ABU3H3P5_9BACL|nr:MurR/RpiR family transcriptional regulator [Paenibacillus forsythiae]MDT3425346.1 DNA-binding MurR/RpiR family transcriptional regulator [Paenibacillus forsythiae]
MNRIEIVYQDYANERNLNQAESDILHFLIDKKFDGQHLSIRSAANDLFVSTTTIIRLCKKLGFSGYSEFVYNLNLKVSKMLAGNVQSVEDIHQSLAESILTFRRNFDQTFDSLNQSAILRFLDEIKTHKMIYFYGAGFSTLFSNYLAKKLELFGYYVSNTTTNDSRGIFLNNIQKYKLLIVFSRSGNTGKVMEKVKLAKESGLTTILFTGNGGSSTAQIADIVFTVLDPTIESQNEFEVTSYESNMFMLIDLILLLAMKKGIIRKV